MAKIILPPTTQPAQDAAQIEYAISVAKENGYTLEFIPRPAAWFANGNYYLYVDPVGEYCWTDSTGMEVKVLLLSASATSRGYRVIKYNPGT